MTEALAPVASHLPLNATLDSDAMTIAGGSGSGTASARTPGI